MMIVTPTQIDVLERDFELRLLARAESHVRAYPSGWAQGRSPDEIKAFLHAMRAFGLAHGLREENSLLRVIDLSLAGRWPDPLPALALHLLTRPGFSEAQRIVDCQSALAADVSLIDLAPLLEEQL